MGQFRPLFVYFCSFLVTILIQIEKSKDGVLGIRTQGRRMEGPDETTELWRPPSCYIVTFCYLDPGKVGIPSYGDPKGLGTFFIALVTVAVFY